VIEDAINAGNLDKIEKILKGISNPNMEEMAAIKRSLESKNTNVLPILGFTPQEEKIVSDFQAEMTKKNREFYASITPSEQKVMAERVKKPTLALTDGQQKTWNRFVAFNEAEVLTYLSNLPKYEANVVEKALITSKYKKRTGDFNPKKRIIGSGARPRGRPPKIREAPKMKVGEGIKVQALPTNVEFGKYALNTRQLNRIVHKMQIGFI
jgi:hypothetical protein